MNYLHYPQFPTQCEVVCHHAHVFFPQHLSPYHQKNFLLLPREGQSRPWQMAVLPQEAVPDDQSFPLGSKRNPFQLHIRVGTMYSGKLAEQVLRSSADPSPAFLFPLSFLPALLGPPPHKSHQPLIPGWFPAPATTDWGNLDAFPALLDLAELNCEKSAGILIPALDARVGRPGHLGRAVKIRGFSH